MRKLFGILLILIVILNVSLVAYSVFGKDKSKLHSQAIDDFVGKDDSKIYGYAEDNFVGQDGRYVGGTNERVNNRYNKDEHSVIDESKEEDSVNDEEDKDIGSEESLKIVSMSNETIDILAIQREIDRAFVDRLDLLIDTDGRELKEEDLENAYYFSVFCKGCDVNKAKIAGKDMKYILYATKYDNIGDEINMAKELLHKNNINEEFYIYLDGNKDKGFNGLPRLIVDGELAAL